MKKIAYKLCLILAIQSSVMGADSADGTPATAFSETSGVVPIGEAEKKSAGNPTNAVVPASSSVVSPEEPAKMDYTDANPDDFGKNSGPVEGFVFRTAVGVAYQQALSGRFNGIDADGDAYNVYERIVFQPGIRFDLEPGYNITDWFRIGLETAFIYNQVHSVTADGEKDINGGSALGNGGYYQVPVMANIRFQFPGEGPCRGYVGGATGASWNVLQASANGDSAYTSYQWNYVWGATAGFTYNIAPGLDLDLAYKLLSAPNPNFQNAGQFKASYNHAAEIGLAWRF
jgi:opacity protein-like surface antigen